MAIPATSPAGRPVRVVLDGDALFGNLAVVRRHVPTARILAVIKANAYGHGLVWAATRLGAAGGAGGVDGFVVAGLHEAMQLRDAGIEGSMVVLGGFHDRRCLEVMAAGRLEPVIHAEHQLRVLEHASLEGPIDVWLKVDTGMHRLGFAPDQVAGALGRLGQCSGVRFVRLMSHFASSDHPEDPANAEQIRRFDALVRATGLQGSLANSGGLISFAGSHYDWVRPGIMLYGASPLTGHTPESLDLRPVMSFETRLIAIHHRQMGDAIGYGATYRCPEDMRVGVLAAGYGDGYPRSVREGTCVWISGRRAPIIGRVSMDLITVDLRGLPDAVVGERVVLWGQELPVDEIATAAGTISYELLLHITDRVSRVIAQTTQ